MNVCFLQIETLNNKAREEGGESQKRREGYGFIYCPNHVKHETGIYNTVLRAVERGGEKRREIGRDRKRSANEGKRTQVERKRDGNGKALGWRREESGVSTAPE